MISTSPPTASRTSLDDLDVAAPVVVVEAELDGAHAAVAQRRDAPGALLAVDGLAARGVGEQALGAAAEQPPERLAERRARRGPRSRPRPSTGGRRGSRPSRRSRAPTSVRAGRRRRAAAEQRGVGQVVAARVAGDPSSERTISVASRRARLGIPGGANGGSSGTRSADSIARSHVSRLCSRASRLLAPPASARTARRREERRDAPAARGSPADGRLVVCRGSTHTATRDRSADASSSR